MKLPFSGPKIKLLESRASRVIMWIVAILAALTILTLYLINRHVTPIALSIAKSQARALASDAIYSAVLKSARDVTYGDLISIIYDSSGRVSLVQANSIRMNEIASQIALSAQTQIGQTDLNTLYIPIGTVIGGPVFSGRGPALSVRVTPIGSITTQFSTSFNSEGVNQTRHEIYLTLKAIMRIAISTQQEEIEVSVHVPIAETLIVGDVPQTYLHASEHDILNLIP